MNAVKLKHIARIDYGLGQPPPLSDSGVPILRATNIERGKIVEQGLIFTALENLSLRRTPLLKEGEILVVRSGAYTGDSAIVTSAWADSAPGYDLRVTVVAAEPRFVAYCLLGRRVLGEIDLAKTRAAQPHLNAEDLGDIEIPWRRLDDQRRIADYLDAETGRLDSLVTAREAQKAGLLGLWRSRLAEVMERQFLKYGSIPLRRVAFSVEQGWSPQCDDTRAEPDEWAVLKDQRGQFG